MKLVIVESPAKAKTIEKYLGKGFTVRASVGHIRDLPKSNKDAVDIEGGFKPRYMVVKEKEDVIAQLGAPDFARLRIGIGHPGSSSQVVAYVLKKAPKPEQSLIDDAIARAQQHLADIVHGEFARVMNALHAK